jgi:hypothetical protein
MPRLPPLRGGARFKAGRTWRDRHSGKGLYGWDLVTVAFLANRHSLEVRHVYVWSCRGNEECWLIWNLRGRESCR